MYKLTRFGRPGHNWTSETHWRLRLSSVSMVSSWPLGIRYLTACVTSEGQKGTARRYYITLQMCLQTSTRASTFEVAKAFQELERKHMLFELLRPITFWMCCHLNTHHVLVGVAAEHCGVYATKDTWCIPDHFGKWFDWSDHREVWYTWV